MLYHQRMQEWELKFKLRNAAANGQPPVEAPVGAVGYDQVALVGGVAGEEARRQPLGHAWWGFLKRKYKCL